MLELVAPAIGGIVTSDGTKVEANYNLDGGPSALFDAVVLLISDEGARQMAHQPVALDFVTDAFAHCKFIGYAQSAMPLFDKANLTSIMDAGFVALEGSDMSGFVQTCRQLRFWERESTLTA